MNDSEKKIVISASKTGFTRRYANWISEELECAAISKEEADIRALSNYDVVVFGGGLYAGKINGLDFIKKNMDVLQEKKIAVFVTGATLEESQDINTVKDMNLKEYPNMPLFYFQAGLDYGRMNAGDKFLMSLMKMALKVSGKKEMYENIKTSFDKSSRDKIKPLIDYVNAGMPI